MSIDHIHRRGMRRRRLVIAGLLLIVSIGCSQPGQAGEITRSAASCELRQVAASNAEFSRISGLAVDATGRVHVADAGALDVVVLSPDGSVTERRGRGGRGPGEFSDLSGIQLTRGDSILTLDRQLNRLTWFPLEGGEVRVLNLSQVSPFPPPFGVVQTGDGSLLVEYRQYYRADDDPADDADRRRSFRLLSPEGVLLRDSLLILPEPETHTIVRRGQIAMSTPNPFGRLAPWTLSPADQIVYGWGDSLAVDVYSLDGRKVGGFHQDVPPQPITPAELNTVIGRQPQDFHAALRAAAPATWPAFQQMVVDDRGSIWVGVTTPLGQPTLWQVFTPDGELLCTDSLPETTRIAAVREGRAYAIVLDDDDVPHVHVYAVAEVRR